MGKVYREPKNFQTLEIKSQNQILSQNSQKHNQELQTRAESTFNRNRGLMQKLIKRDWVHPEWLMFLSLTYITQQKKDIIIDNVLDLLAGQYKIEVTGSKALYSRVEKMALLSVARPNHSTFNMKTHRLENNTNEVSFQMSRLSKPVTDYPVLCEFDMETRVMQVEQRNTLSPDPEIMNFQTGGFRKDKS